MWDGDSLCLVTQNDKSNQGVPCQIKVYLAAPVANHQVTSRGDPYDVALAVRHIRQLMGLGYNNKTSRSAK